MTSGLLSLKWNNHRSTFFHVLSSIRSKESYCDATLACDGRFYPVHKLVLSTCSEYFEQIFEKTQCKHPVIVLKDIKYDDLEALMNYMYVGEVNVLQEKLAGLIKAAECLKIKGLAVPDEDPAASVNKRNQVIRDSVSPVPKRRRRDNVSSFERDRHTSSRSSRDHHQVSHVESQDDGDPLDVQSGIVDGGLSDQLTVQSAESESEQADGDKVENHSKRTSVTQRSSHQPNPEVTIDETSVKAEPPDIQEEDVDNKETLHTNLGFDPPSGDADSLGADPGSVASGSNDAPFTDSNLMDSAPQSVEDVVAQALPQSSTSFQGNSFSLWESEGSLQNFPGEGFSGENSQGRPMDWLWHSPDNDQMRQKLAPLRRPDVRISSKSRSRRRETLSFPCTFCPHVARDRCDLRKHMYTHTGEKPFPCPYCRYRSTQSSSLNIHLRRRHSELLFPPEVGMETGETGPREVGMETGETGPREAGMETGASGPREAGMETGASGTREVGIETGETGPLEVGLETRDMGDTT